MSVWKVKEKEGGGLRGCRRGEERGALSCAISQGLSEISTNLHGEE